MKVEVIVKRLDGRVIKTVWDKHSIKSYLWLNVAYGGRFVITYIYFGEMSVPSTVELRERQKHY